MRLSVTPASLSAQLLIDLGKIYQPYFKPENLTPQALTELIEQQEHTLFVSIFNERHLGAVNVYIEGYKATLSLLSIRELTRRRGVAINLLSEVEKKLKTQSVKNISLDLNTFLREEQTGLRLFMQAAGYKIIDNNCIKNI